MGTYTVCKARIMAKSADRPLAGKAHTYMPCEASWQHFPQPTAPTGRKTIRRPIHHRKSNSQQGEPLIPPPPYNVSAATAAVAPGTRPVSELTDTPQAGMRWVFRSGLRAELTFQD